MKLKPCPNCSAAKHPLKACPECGLSSLRQEGKQRPPPPSPTIWNEPVVPAYGVGFLGRNRLHPKYRYDVLDDDSEIHPYQSAFDEDLRDVDLDASPLSSSTYSHEPPGLLSDALPPLTFAHLKPAVHTQYAAQWVVDKPAAQMPMKPVWEVHVYDGWPCPATMNFAKKFLQDLPDVTLRDLQRAIMDQVTQATLPHPHLWRIRVGISRLTSLYRDVEGQFYVALDGDWRLAYSLRHMGGLVQAKGFSNPQAGVLPPGGYFVCWESEDQARDYYQHRKLSKPETQEDD